MRERLLGYAFVLPAVILLGAFGIFPLLYALGLSLTESSNGSSQFVGAAHYQDAVGTRDFWNSVKVTLWYAVGTVPLALALSLAVGVALFRIRRFAGLLRTAFLLPYVTSVVAAGMVWRALYEPRSGLINGVLQWAGLPTQIWLLEPRGVLSLITGGLVSPETGPSLALVSVMTFEVWRSCGFMVVVILAGLAGVPRELEDAARLDGASPWQAIRHVTLPLLTPTIFFLSVVGALHALQAFSDIYAMTGDGRGPLNTTQNVAVYIFTSFYDAHRQEYGAAVAILLAVGIMALTGAQWRLLGRRVHYE